MLIAFSIITLEAWLDARYGDKNKWISFILSAFISVGGAMMFGVGPLNSLMWWIMARTWFDIIFNLFAGHPWWYLGEDDKPKKYQSRTDNILKEFEPVTVLLMRLIISLGCLVVILN